MTKTTSFIASLTPNKMKELNTFREFLNENEVEPQTDLIGIAAHTLKDMSKEEAIDAIDRLMLYLKDAKADIEYKDSGFNLSEREVTVTDEHKAEMLKVAQDLRNLVKTHDAVEGTRLLGGKMQQRDALIKAANTLEILAK